MRCALAELGKFNMDKQIKTEWVSTLRSGKYKQAAGSLRTNYGYCCLGVLCDIAGKGKWKSYEDGGYGYETQHTISRQWIPSDLEFEIGNIPQHELANMNDDDRSFDEIADWIEENVEDEPCVF